MDSNNYDKQLLNEVEHDIIIIIIIIIIITIITIGQEECHVTLRMLISTSKLLKEPLNRTIDVFPYFIYIFLYIFLFHYYYYYYYYF